MLVFLLILVIFVLNKDSLGFGFVFFEWLGDFVWGDVIGGEIFCVSFFLILLLVLFLFWFWCLDFLSMLLMLLFGFECGLFIILRYVVVFVSGIFFLKLFL